MPAAGVLTPIPTPFDRHGDVDAGRLRAALTHWLTTPLHGFVILGSNGESALVDERESDHVVAVARDVVPRGRAFIVGAGRESTRATIDAGRRAASLGADALLVRTPGFFKTQMTAPAFVRHYTAVADASSIPVMLYNFTAVTGVTLPIEAVAQLSAHPNIVGMKESNGDIQRVADLIAAVPAEFRVLVGSSTTFCDAIRLGAAGGILALASVVPDASTRVFEWTRAGRHDEAAALQQQLLPLAKLLGMRYGVPGLKAALKLIGCDVGDPRPPLLPLDEAAISEIRQALATFQDANGTHADLQASTT